MLTFWILFLRLCRGNQRSKEAMFKSFLWKTNTLCDWILERLTNHKYPSVLVTGLYEVNVIPTEDSDRLELAGNYLMTVRKEYLCLHSAKTGERVFQWELDHLPRFRLQRLSHLQDLDKVLTFQAARWGLIFPLSSGSRALEYQNNADNAKTSLVPLFSGMEKFLLCFLPFCTHFNRLLRKIRVHCSLIVLILVQKKNLKHVSAQNVPSGEKQGETAALFVQQNNNIPLCNLTHHSQSPSLKSNQTNQGWQPIQVHSPL